MDAQAEADVAAAEEIAAFGEDEFAADAAPAFDLTAAEDDEPPFDPPDIDDDEEPSLADDGDDAALDLVERFDDALPPARFEAGESPLELRARVEDAAVASAPAISIHLSWDRPEAARLADALAADRRMAKTIVTHDRGGFEGAASAWSVDESPDLLIVQTSLAAREMLPALLKLQTRIKPSARIVVIGSVNDVSLLRRLMQNGASSYLLDPVMPDQLVSTICELYAEAVTSRVIAVVGARGGVGASTLAYNLAWSIGARRCATATLADLDVCFGAAAFGFDRKLGQPAQASLLEGKIDDARLERDAFRPAERLRVLPAPASLACDGGLDELAVQGLMEQLRRTSAFVVLDLPHAWSPGVRQALIQADEVILVATPDLASMRNAKNLFDALKGKRPAGHEPMLVMSMVGAPRRPEIAPKEFAEAIGVEPVCALAFDAGLFGLAELKGVALDEAAPSSKAAEQIDALAGALTGLKPKARQRKTPTPEQTAVRPAPVVASVAEPAAPAPAQTAPLRPRRPRNLDRLARSPRTRRGRPGTLRALVAAVALALAGGWAFEQNRIQPDYFHSLGLLAVDFAG